MVFLKRISYRLWKS